MRKRLRLGLGVVLSGLLASACGGTAQSSDESDEHVGQAAESLVSGTSGVGVTDISRSSANWSTGAWQSEVSGASSLLFQYAAYNAEDTNTNHVTYPVTTVKDSNNRLFVDRVVCSGTNQVGTNFEDPFSDTDWTDAHHLPMPPNTAVVWGDPALFVYDGFSWVSALVSPNDVFTARSNFTNAGRRCFRTSDVPGSTFPASFEGALAGACVFHANQGSSVNENITYTSSKCFRRSNGLDSATGGDFFDGGVLYPGSDDTDGALYAAYDDETSHTLALYRWPLEGSDSSWAPVVGDNTVHLDGHPILASNDDGLFVIAANGSQLKIWKHAGSWTSGTVVASDLARGVVTLKDNITQVRGVNYTGTLLSPADGTPERIVIFYQATNGTKTNLKGLLCNPVTLTCTNSFTIGSSSFNAFMPAITHGFRSSGTQVNLISYWSDQSSSGPNVVLRYSTFTTSGSLGTSVGLTQGQRVCPGEGVGYWGDYDAMWNVSGLSFARTITDSTWATCDTTTRANLDFRQQDQHVSVLNFNVP